MAEFLQCTVYKSLKQLDYFIYLRTEDEFSQIPDGLRQLLGNLEKVLDLELHAGRKLAQADAVEVMTQIRQRGYYLQMPPRSGSDLLVS